MTSFISPAQISAPSALVTPPNSPIPTTSQARSFPPSPKASTSHFTYPSPQLHQFTSPLLPSAPLVREKGSGSPSSCDMRRSPGMQNLNLFTRSCYEDEAKEQLGIWSRRESKTSLSLDDCSSPELPSSPDSPFNSDDDDDYATSADSQSIFSVDIASDFSVSTTSSPTLQRVSGKITPAATPTTPSRRVRRRTLSYSPSSAEQLIDVNKLVLNSPVFRGEVHWEKENLDCGWKARGLGLGEERA